MGWRCLVYHEGLRHGQEKEDKEESHVGLFRSWKYYEINTAEQPRKALLLVKSLGDVDTDEASIFSDMRLGDGEVSTMMWHEGCLWVGLSVGSGWLLNSSDARAMR